MVSWTLGWRRTPFNISWCKLLDWRNALVAVHFLSFITRVLFVDDIRAMLVVSMSHSSSISSWPLWCKRTRLAMRTNQPKQATRWLKLFDVLQRFLAFFLSSSSLFPWTLFPVAASCLGKKRSFDKWFVPPSISFSDSWFLVSRFSDPRSFLTNDTSLVYFVQYHFLSRRSFRAAVVNSNYEDIIDKFKQSES